MTNTLIRGGTVVDGTGAPAFTADVRIADGRITEIGASLASRDGERVVDARGCCVTPGFIESHTHYDGTVWWQPDMDPVPGYGVTTVVMGNCGFAAAPLSDDEAARLEMVKIFSFFEDIPIEPFLQNVPWDWHSWPEYKQSLTSKVKVPVNYGIFVGHIAIRLAVMGMAAWERKATAEEISRMAKLLDEALGAGAMGLSTNQMDHDGDNRPIPTLHADDAEFEALLDVMLRHPGTTLQVIVDTFMRLTAPDTVERFERLTATRPVRVQLAGGTPTLYFQQEIAAKMLPLHEKHKREGRDIWSGYGHVAITSVLSLKKSLIFAQSNEYVWHEVVLAETAEEKLSLLKDPEWRARARDSWDNKAWAHSPFSPGADLHLLNSENGVGPVNITLREYAAQRGLHRADAMAEWFIANTVDSTVHMAPFPQNEDLVVSLIKDPLTVGNISDAGAHGQMLCGGGENMLLFTKYLKSGRITLEEAVHVQTGKLARHFGFSDIGEIKVGKRADLVVFNLDEIDYRPMRKVYDVPDGKGDQTWRWTRDPAPMRMTMVGGVPTFEAGGTTGNRPGAFLGVA
ncbi:MAG: amidohydrolase family protein [Proteobacteria bacterium]|nr:amidohydrolase family protein [Pseudomonadota bacterium]HQR03848.1 amidohydrolase family protein [Rhodocyclaceae bacterium]